MRPTILKLRLNIFSYDFVTYLLRFRWLRRMPLSRHSKKLEQLRRNPAELLYFTKGVFFFKDPKFVELHSPQQPAINRTHDLGRDHRFAVCLGQSRRRFAE